MTVKEIHDKCVAVERRLSDLGYVTPECHFAVHYLNADVSLWINYKAGPNACRHAEVFYANLGAPLPFEALDAFIDDLPPTAELARRDVVASLGKLIDQAREADIPVEFLNPLEASMKALSENVLEAR